MVYLDIYNAFTQTEFDMLDKLVVSRQPAFILRSNILDMTMFALQESTNENNTFNEEQAIKASDKEQAIKTSYKKQAESLIDKGRDEKSSDKND